ncbi:hypothetical protein LR48_Vigan01g221100 [Vigna angularis]|uniref:Uncharacterized protein n=1 Tax=Phaseolus angularis TaxID=3914 RepID=A0A0L9TQ17_PHAAN|nr:hypothetical protein LR48_Vigan01g221100 [Vigna angularis]
MENDTSTINFDNILTRDMCQNREKANPRVSPAPSHPANSPLPRNVSVQAWSAGVSRDEVVSVPVTDSVGSFDWNHQRQRRVLSYRRLRLLTHPIIVEELQQVREKYVCDWILDVDNVQRDEVLQDLGLM